ncbi:N,N-dimethylformamidase beta subunit family domain-containing protein [Candidatus Nitrosotenuis sp. DW1]|uniref:N,N-dimethylformamidase beta subunit family domain-containing protein n=1 Tax=Candidatus Nitrosotenuis sp. DW1 TaxID=2259672 RepID=UPI0015C98072|nr:N,N-dimethylformamidase beta subunit family domain-containing protein [Candidatus Nitrosotenuis sp. DW1]QLH09773.1 hypothetical protein DSQ19_10155 [Candidatus Nitrosotenuis sp. DW1]
MNHNLLLFVILIILVVGFIAYYIIDQNTTLEKKLKENLGKETSKRELSVEGSLFRVLTRESDIQINYETKTITYSNADFELKPELMDLYHKIGFLNKTHNSVVVYPIFTEAAYNKNGFYDFYEGKCDSSCLTAKISTDFNGEYSSSRAAFNSLRLLGYHYITDIDIDKDPEILKKYDSVILLHNEYVTKKEFDAITQHPKVIYLYPNALYAEVVSDYDSNTITLIRGHGYPSPQIRNGFDWKFDNSNLEYDNMCTNWKFYEIDNGIMLNCYPEYVIFKDQTLLLQIKNYS